MLLRHCCLGTACARGGAGTQARSCAAGSTRVGAGVHACLLDCCSVGPACLQLPCAIVCAPHTALSVTWILQGPLPVLRTACTQNFLYSELRCRVNCTTTLPLMLCVSAQRLLEEEQARLREAALNAQRALERVSYAECVLFSSLHHLLLVTFVVDALRSVGRCNGPSKQRLLASESSCKRRRSRRPSVAHGRQPPTRRLSAGSLRSACDLPRRRRVQRKK